MEKKRFALGTVTGTNNLRGNPGFLLNFNRYLTEENRVDPATYELVTIASCAGHYFAITREIQEKESEDIEYLTETSYASMGRSAMARVCTTTRAF